MAKRSAGNRKASSRGGRKKKQATRSAKRPNRPVKKGAARKAAKKAAPKRTPRRVVGQGSKAAGTARGNAPKNKRPRTVRTKATRLDRVRRTLEETVQTPPSSLDMNRRGTAARTGRDEMEQSRREHASMTPAITGGDVDADWETAYFSGDEAPGGDNPTPDQDVVEDIGKALGVQYEDNEELKAADKVTQRDKHRWELDPASSEDYKERD